MADNGQGNHALNITGVELTLLSVEDSFKCFSAYTTSHTPQRTRLVQCSQITHFLAERTSNSSPNTFTALFQDDRAFVRERVILFAFKMITTMAWNLQTWRPTIPEDGFAVLPRS